MYSNTKPRRAADQGDKNMEFAGQGSPVSYRQSPKYRTNQWSGHANDGRDVNFGMGPRKGNTGDRTAGPVEATSMGRRVDPNKINVGAGPRTAGGKTVEAKCPPNPDKINVGMGPRKGNQQ